LGDYLTKVTSEGFEIKFLGLEKPADGNYDIDIIPISIFPRTDIEEIKEEAEYRKVDLSKRNGV